MAFECRITSDTDNHSHFPHSEDKVLAVSLPSSNTLTPMYHDFIYTDFSTI